MFYDEKVVKFVLATLQHNKPALYKSDAYAVCRAIRIAHPSFFTKDPQDNRRYVFTDSEDTFNRIEVLAEMTRKSVTKSNDNDITFVPEDLGESDESDDEILIRINETFNTLRVLSKAACDLKIKSLIVSGSPGTGKSYEVLRAIQNNGIPNHATVLKGTISPVSLYIELYFARKGVLVLDDCDAAFSDPDALNLLKAATETSKNRQLSYKKLSSALEERGVPDTFLFEGCVVVLTNTDLENGRGQKSNHYEAIISRAHFINACLNTQKEKLIRIKSVIDNGELFKDVSDDKVNEIVEFITNNCNSFRELSIRTVVKISELYNGFPNDWKTLARGTLFSRRVKI
jgi:hypothetical protein